MALGAAAALPGKSSAASAEPAATLVFEGKVVTRDEVWDRRSNPLMGRPDFLIEATLGVTPIAVRSGSLPPNTVDPLTISFKGDTLSAANKARPGWTGIFHVRGNVPPFEGLAFEPGTPPPPVPRPVPPPPRPAPPPPFPEGVGGRALRADPALRARAVRAIAGRYRMTDASALFLTSHSGPMPPSGGYVLWGVKGRIRGAWHVWQPGMKRPRPGTELVDPHRYQK